MYGSDMQERADIDNVVFFVEDLRAPFVSACYSADFESRRASLAEGLPPKLTRLERWFEMRDGPFVASKEISLADFFVYEVLDLLVHFDPAVLASFPKCAAFHMHIHTLPQIAAYRASDRCHKSFNNKSAKWGGNF